MRLYLVAKTKFWRGVVEFFLGEPFQAGYLGRCPGNILHGLYMMGLMARANSALGAGDPRALKRLSVQFRGMGLPEQEIAVRSTVREERDGAAVVDTLAEQSGKAIIRNAEAELSISSPTT